VSTLPFKKRFLEVPPLGNNIVLKEGTGKYSKAEVEEFRKES
jgi:hypothetical protein